MAETNLSAFIWSVADLLRGDYKQSDYGPEWNAVSELLKQRRKDLELADNSISGFNIGLNSGESAGQTVMHAHWHLIPRRKGDTAEPQGGVRGVIPSRMRYG